ncbi:hypothetical protein [Flavobacterium sp.]|uniref:hypothetical protein n=1 Tax=Flavobacterium sp. TaxID=239 RepID=UPI0037BDBB07
MKKIQIILILIAGVFFVSCESSTYDQISVVNLNPTYSGQIGPIVQANCVGCHSTGSQYPDLSNYTLVKDATQNGHLICRIDQAQSCGNVMPQSGAMSVQVINMFKLWQQQGCIN